MASFFTLSRNGEYIFKDRGSKFIGLSFQVTTEEEVRTSLADARKRFPAAAHYCYAWRLGPQGRQRSSDDGEPAGSAGRPILNQLTSANISDALVVVVRYFGGTLLGVGGLMNAYKTAAAGAISNSGTRERHVMARFIVSFSPEDTSPVMHILRSYEAIIHTNTYDALSHVGFSIKEMHSPSLESKFAELYRVTLKRVE